MLLGKSFTSRGASCLTPTSPRTIIVSLPDVLANGQSAEIVVVGNDGIVSFPSFWSWHHAEAGSRTEFGL